MKTYQREHNFLSNIAVIIFKRLLFLKKLNRQFHYSENKSEYKTVYESNTNFGFAKFNTSWGRDSAPLSKPGKMYFKIPT